MINSTVYLMLRNFAVLSSLKTSELEKLSGQVVIKRIEKNTLIYDADMRSEYVYLIRKGSVKLGAETTEGKILIKEVVYEESLFGENVFVGEGKRKEFAKAITETSLIMIPVDAFTILVETNGAFAQSIMGVVLNRIKMLDERVESFMFKKAKSRIEEFIRRIGDARGESINDHEIEVNHKLTHREIAHLTDTSRQTVARVLSELKSENIIQFSARRPNKMIIRERVMAV